MSAINDNNESYNSADNEVDRTKISAPVQKQLTQISQKLKQHDTKEGFAEAKKQVDAALASKKLILNNRFVLESTLGSGGMGTVYQAQDLRKVEAQDQNPFVAIKVLSGDFKQHPDAFIALQREASRSASLAHPNIVTVYDFDRDDDTVYMTMERLKGQDLFQIIEANKENGLERSKALAIIKDYCNALSYAHKKGVIHCDLKPANIFVTQQGTKVLDFGIARLAIENQDHFDAGKMGALTPGYASFEMFHRESPNASDDVFAAAVIAYELLTGKHPYDEVSAITADALKKTPAPITDLPKHQWKALQAALQLKKSDRTQNIDEFTRAFFHKSKVPVFKIVSSMILVGLASFAYYNYQSSLQLEQKIETKLKEALLCFNNENFACAIKQAELLLGIQADHLEAQQIYADATAAQEAKVLREKITSIQTKMNQCSNQENWQCVENSAEQLLVLNPTHPEALSHLQTATEMLKQLEEHYLDYMQSANDCFNKSNFNCSIKQSEQALQLKPNDEKAEELIQRASFALHQQKSTQEKVKSIVKDGRQCFKKFDYSCAIAKAEVALELIATDASAIKLKQDATKAINDAKKAITIE